MTIAMFAELTADGQQIALVPVADDDWDGNKAGAARLKRLTAHHVLHTDENGLRDGAILLPATYATVVQLGFSFNAPGFSWHPQDRLNDWATAEIIRRTDTPAPLTLELPPGRKPRPYQVDNAERIAHAGTFFLLDDPGLGKTVSTILGIEERRVRGHDVFPLIIIVPSWEVADSWAEHILGWAPAWARRVRMHGGPKRVQGIGARNRHQYAGDVFITTYATLRRDAGERGPLTRLEAASVVLDEFHWIRNPDAEQTHAAGHAAKHATTMVFTSGTGIARDTGDLYPPLKISDPRSWPSKKRMRARYLTTLPDEAGYDEKITGLDPAAEEEFRAILAGQMHRYAKADVLPELPPKIYSKRIIDIPPEWRAAYDQMEDDWLAELPGSGELSALDSLARLTRLSQLASSAADVRIEMVLNEETGEWEPKQIVTLRAPSWKAEGLIRFLGERRDQPTAVFTESRQLAMITGTYCEDAGLRTGYITGTGARTSGNEGPNITQGTRRQAREGFQAGRLDVIVCTAGAGGTGITLTAADCAVMLQRSYQYDLGIQPEDRVHRIGAEIHDHVEIADFVARDTVDQRRRDVLRDKAGMLGQLVMDPRIVRELLGGKR